MAVRKVKVPVAKSRPGQTTKSFINLYERGKRQKAGLRENTNIGKLIFVTQEKLRSPVLMDASIILKEITKYPERVTKNNDKEARKRTVIKSESSLNICAI